MRHTYEKKNLLALSQKIEYNEHESVEIYVCRCVMCAFQLGTTSMYVVCE